MQVFVKVLLTLWEKHHLKAELIIVEWNPPEDALRLQDALIWPDCMKSGRIRIVEVPDIFHYRLPNSDRMPMFEYIAKNVGIRRAEGEYVLATNPDLLYDEALIKFLSLEELSRNSFYRVDRYDVAPSIPADLTVEEQLEFCAKHVSRVATVDGTVPIARFRQTRRHRFWPLMLVKKPSTHAENGYARRDRLHTNASGDFFLMGRQEWHEIRGYPELMTHSFIDGYACFMAAALGLRQVVLNSPMRIFHQEHDRSVHRERPQTDYDQYLKDGRRMLESQRPRTPNNENWGLGDEQLVEQGITP